MTENTVRNGQSLSRDRLLLGAVMFIAAVAITPAHGGQIRWRSGTIEVPVQSRQETAQAITAMSLRGADRHVVVQFDHPLGPVERRDLTTAGLTLLSYLGDSLPADLHVAFFASLAPQGVDAAGLARVQALTALLPVERTWKLHPMLAADRLPEWAIVRAAASGTNDLVGQSKPRPVSATKRQDPLVGVYVLFHTDVGLVDEAANAVWRHGGMVLSEIHSVNGLVVELPASQIKPLAGEDVVKWIEPPLPTLTATNDSNRERVGADTLQQLPYGLDGSGITVMVYDVGHARGSHEDFGGPLHCR